MSREEVYKVIDSERDYQDEIWGHKDTFNSVGDFLTYMDYYLTKAKKEYTTNKGSAPALEELRKLVALGVACFEVNRVSKRIK